jgi:hypothetical protein
MPNDLSHPWDRRPSADWNNPFYYQDRTASTLGWPQPWWDHQEGGELRQTNRAAARILTSGGLYDAAAALGHPRPVTTGHWPSERNGPRPIDAILATAAMVDTIRDASSLTHTRPATPQTTYPPASATTDHPRWVSTSPLVQV